MMADLNSSKHGVDKQFQLAQWFILGFFVLLAIALIDYYAHLLNNSMIALIKSCI